MWADQTGKLEFLSRGKFTQTFKLCSLTLKNVQCCWKMFGIMQCFFRNLQSRKHRGEGHLPRTLKCPGTSLPSDGGFNYTQSDFVVSRLVLFMQPQTSCNLILLASLRCNLRLEAIYAVTGSFDIARSHGAGGGHSDRILSLCVSVNSFSIRRFWGKGRRDCEK